MRRVKRRTLLASVVAGLGSIAIAVTTGPVADAAPSTAPRAPASSNGAARYLASVNGYQRLVDSVVAQVRALNSSVTLVEIDGSSPSGASTSVFAQTRWRFVFNGVDAGKLVVYFATVNLPDPVATVVMTHDVYVGSDPLTQPVAMSPHRAAQLLWKAGYHQPYDVVTYRKPNAGGETAHPLFIFPQPGGRYVAVDTVTGAVDPLT